MKDQPPITTELTTENVHNLILDCLFKYDELPEIPGNIITDKEAISAFLTERNVNFTMVEGVAFNAIFSKDRLNQCAKEIKDLLKQLPEEFDAHGDSEGYSFLQACMDRSGNQWGEQRDADALIALGIALGLVKFLAPRHLWQALPGGMPYLAIDYTKF